MIAKPVSIVFHTQYYHPEIGAPQSRLRELAAGLTKKGMQVTVLTSMPSYPQGRIYPGYRGWFHIEFIDGIRVIRTGIYPTQSPKMSHRLLNYLSFMVSSLLIGGWAVGRVDYIMTESPPLFLGLAGLALSFWKRAKWIFNISDLWPRSVVELGILEKESQVYKLAQAIEEGLYKNAWAVTGQAKTILDDIKNRLPNLKTYHLSNGVDSGYFLPKEWESREQDFHIVYAGLHGLAQGLSEIIQAAGMLPPDMPVFFTFAGDGPEKKRLIKMQADMGLSCIRFLDPMPKDEILKLLNSANAVVVPLKMQLTGAVPSKLYEAMSVAKPVILVAGGEAAEIVAGANCGIVVQPGDTNGLSRAILELKSNPEMAREMGQNGRRAVIEKYDRRFIIEGFSNFLNGEGEN